MIQKIKHFLESEKGKDILVVLIVILVGLGCFELGRLSKENSNTGIKIEYPQGGSIQNTDQAVNIISATDMSKGTFDTNNSGKNFFASSRGSKYYSLGCAAGKNIKMENRIYFTTGEEAQQAGYELSSSCR